MTTRYVNVTIGTTRTSDGGVPITAVSHASAAANHVSIAYDDATILYRWQLIAAVKAGLDTALGNASLKS